MERLDQDSVKLATARARTMMASISPEDCQ